MISYQDLEYWFQLFEIFVLALWSMFCPREGLAVTAGRYDSSLSLKNCLGESYQVYKIPYCPMVSGITKVYKFEYEYRYFKLTL